MTERDKKLGRLKPDTFHLHSMCEHVLPLRTPLEEDTGWIVLQQNGTRRKAKPQEVPKKLTCGVRPEDGLDEIDESLANQLLDETDRIPKKRGVRH